MEYEARSFRMPEARKTFGVGIGVLIFIVLLCAVTTPWWFALIAIVAVAGPMWLCLTRIYEAKVDASGMLAFVSLARRIRTKVSSVAEIEVRVVARSRVAKLLMQLNGADPDVRSVTFRFDGRRVTFGGDVGVQLAEWLQELNPGIPTKGWH